MGHRQEVDITVGGESFIEPVQENVQDFWVVLEESRVEEQSQGSPVLVVMSVEVVDQEVVKLFRGWFGRETGVYHSASRKFLKKRVFSPVQLIHDNFPDSERPGGAFLPIAVTSVGHSVEKHVWPQWGILKRGGDCGVIEEEVFLHHGELVVAADSQVRSTDSIDVLVRNIGEVLDYLSCSSHLFAPFFSGSFCPE